MDKLPYWNHNIAYYHRIKNQTKECNSVLDVGCGNGLLIQYLDNGKTSLTGIDTDLSCIESCRSRDVSENSTFFQNDFLSFESENKYDAITFVASIHHMDMEAAVNKAKSLLNQNGRMIIVGLAKPSGIFDYCVEAFRIVPVFLISAIRKSTSSEELNVPVSYDMPTMRYVRKVKKTLLPHSKFRYGLYYRYILTWVNR